MSYAISILRRAQKEFAAMSRITGEFVRQSLNLLKIPDHQTVKISRTRRLENQGRGLSRNL